MKIDRKKLPVKYALEIYSEVPGFPSYSDLEYILVNALEERELLEKEFTAEQLWEAFKYCLGTIAELRLFLDKVFCPGDMHDLTDNILGDKVSANSYRLSSHGWMN